MIIFLLYYFNIKMKQILITCLLETSDHDGYCSGEECYYESNQVVYLTDVPLKYSEYDIGIIDDPEQDWTEYLPEPNINIDGSGYCDPSQESLDAGLNCHDYRYTIIKVEIVNLLKF